MDTIQMNEKDKILVTKKGPVGTLTFNYPEKLNAISPEMSQASGSVIYDLAGDPAVRVVILLGAGNKAVVSGGNI